MKVKLNRSKVQSKIAEANNKVYEVVFVKKDGTLRKMLAKQGVEYKLSGGENPVVKSDNSYLSTFDVDIFEYRTINLATIKTLKVNGVKYKVVD